MSPRGRSERADHREAWELLPWYSNGTLEGEELSRLERHLEICSRCRAELEIEDQVATAVRNSEELVFSRQRGWADLEQRIVALDRSAASRRPSTLAETWQAGLARLSVGTRLALAAQMIVIAILGSLVVAGRTPRGQFETLATPAAQKVEATASALLRVVFSQDAPESALRELVLQVGGRFVDGPSTFGVYTLGVPRERAVEALEILRRSTLVAFAEPAAEDDGP